MRAHTLALLVPLLYVTAAWSHEGGPSCDSKAAQQPAIADARDALKQKPRSLAVRMNLADRLIDSGCYDEAVHVLEDGAQIFPSERNLQTRLRTARSFIKEREF